MARDRFLVTLSMLHFADNEKQVQGDLLYKVREVLTKIKQTFIAQFSPFQDLVIVESMVLFKGRLMFKQYIETKIHKFGIKLYMLCDCETGFVLDLIVYTGAQTEMESVPELGVSGGIVATLMKPYLNKGHSYADNYYTSPTLSASLFDCKTNSCGTVRLNRKCMPVLRRKLTRGRTESLASQEMLAVKWRDHREVTVLTTVHRNVMVTLNKKDRKTQEYVRKPQCVIDYNEKMGAVDCNDMMLSSMECIRKKIKWYRKLFFLTVDLCLLNAHALYLTKTGNRVALAKFQLDIIHQLLERYHTPQAAARGGRPSASAHTHLRLTEIHFPSLVPPMAKRKDAVRR
jgi:hypothetical protein